MTTKHGERATARAELPRRRGRRRSLEHQRLERDLERPEQRALVLEHLLLDQRAQVEHYRLRVSNRSICLSIDLNAVCVCVCEIWNCLFSFRYMLMTQMIRCLICLLRFMKCADWLFCCYSICFKSN